MKNDNQHICAVDSIVLSEKFDPKSFNKNRLDQIKYDKNSSVNLHLD